MDFQPGPTVVIPVHNAHDELKACLASVAATLDSTTQVIVIDDASTDPRIIPLIEAVMRAGGPRWRFLRQVRNRGFVGTANLGMRLSHADVVLLNSDTIVTKGWLERIGNCLASHEQIATATPWSNNSEITSLPDFCTANPVPRDVETVALKIAECVVRDGGPRYPEIPTAVGFCMGISKRAMDAVGEFDAVHFGRGYGEENDFCMRARKAGFQNVLCDDAYVAHVGGRSFGPLGLRPGDESMARLLERHPDYEEIVSDFIQGDPLAPLRERLIAAVVAAGLTFD